MERSEVSVIEGLLSGFDASPEEERELLEYARTPRTLEDDIPLALLTAEDRELLFANAALLTNADGIESASERSLLGKLGALLELTYEVRVEILDSVRSASKRAPKPED
jgi:hypothetical protein